MSLPKKREKVIKIFFSIDNNFYFLTPFEPFPKDLPPIAVVLVPGPVGLGTANIPLLSSTKNISDLCYRQVEEEKKV